MTVRSNTLNAPTPAWRESAANCSNNTGNDNCDNTPNALRAARDTRPEDDPEPALARGGSTTLTGATACAGADSTTGPPPLPRLNVMPASLAHFNTDPGEIPIRRATLPADSPAHTASNAS